mmetsp:Transcript_21857/g.63600  ORF Transcript_21857/g.63600 Transcript_21857/m.63600 type:complete len:223 (+) Transcript_21857:404-1072(+)
MWISCKFGQHAMRCARGSQEASVMAVWWIQSSPNSARYSGPIVPTAPQSAASFASVSPLPECWSLTTKSFCASFFRSRSAWCSFRFSTTRSLSSSAAPRMAVPLPRRSKVWGAMSRKMSSSSIKLVLEAPLLIQSRYSLRSVSSAAITQRCTWEWRAMYSSAGWKSISPATSTIVSTGSASKAPASCMRNTTTQVSVPPCRGRPPCGLPVWEERFVGDSAKR